MAAILAGPLLVLGVTAAANPPPPVDEARIRAANEEPGSWLAHGRTYDEQRFSPLDAIHAGNAQELGLAWSHATGSVRGHEATPLVADGVMYATAPWSVVFALDAASGRELWRYDPQVPGSTGRKACCDVVNRGVALWKGRVYVGTLDGRLIALDAKTGAPAWEVQTVDPSRDYTITGAPRVVRDLVVIGNGGGEFGVRGYFSAYDAATGALRWRFYTVPRDTKPPFEHAELERAAATWSPNSLFEAGLGGTVWDSFAYDPELDLLYVGVGNSTPYDRELRSPGGGDNLFLASILALRPTTGELVWHYQTTPAENWDYTATQHMILADLEIGGETRAVLMQAPKNGFFYVLDRATGELLSAEPYVRLNWASHVDPGTGRPVETGNGDWREDGANVLPGPSGGHNWHPMSFSPQTGLVYIPSQEMPYPYVPTRDFEYRKGRFNTGEDLPAMAALVDGFERAVRFCSPTHLSAFDPVAGEIVWRVDYASEINGGVLSTAGGLVFRGTGDGRLVAYRAENGEEVWSQAIGIAVMAPPISYVAGGEQYIAILVGAGGSAGMNFSVIDYQNAGYVMAFKLGGAASLPAVRKAERRPIEAPPATASPEVVEAGRVLYGEHCFRCHGIGTKSGGLLPDLRHAKREVHDLWHDIVLGGVRGSRGMASFADQISMADSEAIHAYVISQAHREPTWLESAGAWLGERVCIPPTWFADGTSVGPRWRAGSN